MNYVQGYNRKSVNKKLMLSLRKQELYETDIERSKTYDTSRIIWG